MSAHSNPWRRLERLETRQRWMRMQGRGAGPTSRLDAVWTRERAEEVLGILAEAGFFDAAPPDGIAPELAAVWSTLATNEREDA